MINQDDVTIHRWTDFDYFVDNDKFDKDMPLAFGISSFMVRNATDDADLDYGSVHAYRDFWNGTASDYEELELRPC